MFCFSFTTKQKVMTMMKKVMTMMKKATRAMTMRRKATIMEKKSPQELALLMLPLLHLLSSWHWLGPH